MGRKSRLGDLDNANGLDELIHELNASVCGLLTKTKEHKHLLCHNATKWHHNEQDAERDEAISSNLIPKQDLDIAVNPEIQRLREGGYHYNNELYRG